MTLPEGTVTFLFSDVEGSTQLLERHPREMGDALARHYELFEEAIDAEGGVIFETVGDAVYAAFASAHGAVAAAIRAQLALEVEDWGPVERIACRIAIHTGEVQRRGDHYFGPALFRCARLQAIGYGEQTLLSQRTATEAAGRLPDGTSLRDLGRHRLKDLGEPEQVFMLLHPELRSTFPAPKSIDLRPNNLPIQLSSFVGREAEVDAVSALVTHHRLVTLTGPGGVGKTRLALQVAGHIVSAMPDGAFVVDLAAVRDAHDIAPATASTLGLDQSQGSAAAQVAEHLNSRHLLLVMDNVEQIDGAAKPMLELLDRAPGLRMLATSRIPLHVRGEQVQEVPPLDVAASDGATAPAVELFVQRATATGQFLMSADKEAIVADICRRLDGMPLAIELAAARTSILEPNELLERLEHRLLVLTGGPSDAPERQRTLRAAIAWSVELLKPRERSALSHLAVFQGGWTAAAAQAVAGADLDTLEHLLEASLVRREGRGFRFLETIREFALELLADAPDAESIADRHARWYADWVQSIGPGHARPPAVHLETPAEFAHLDAERENLAAATERLLATQDGRRARLMAERLWLYWLHSGYLRRAEAWTTDAIELPPAINESERAWLLGVASEYPRFGGEFERAIALKQDLLVLARAAGEKGMEAAALRDMALALMQVGDLERARQFAEDALVLRRKIGEPVGIGHALYGLAEVALKLGEPERARHLFGEAATYPPAQDVPLVLGRIAECSRRLGELDAAAGTLTRAVDELEDWESDLGMEDVLECATGIVADRGDLRLAATLLGTLENLWRTTGMKAMDGELHEQILQVVKARLSPDTFAEAWAEGLGMSVRAGLQRARESCSPLASDET